VDVVHGVSIPDPYRWLEDQWSPETRAWIKAQNDYAHPILTSLPRRAQLERRVGELVKVDDTSMPLERNGRYFFTKRLASQELPVIYVRLRLHGEDKLLVDPHPLSADHTTSVNIAGASKDGTLLAYGARQGGQDELAIKLLNVDTGRELPDSLPRAYYYGISLKPDKTGFYYTRRDPEGPRTFYHAVGTSPESDTKVFGDGFGPNKIIFAEVSDDGHYLLIHVLFGTGEERIELYYQDLTQPGPVRPLVNDLDARFSGEVVGDTAYLQTNWKAPKGRLLAADLRHPARDQWREVVPESNLVMEGFTAAGGRLFVNYTRNASSSARIFEPDGRPVGDIAFPTIGSVSGISGRWESKEAFFTFSSFAVPRTIYHYDAATGTQDVWARPNVPVDEDKYEVKQVWYESKDKTKVPMFLVYAKGLKLDGSHPTLLTGYGGFVISMTPSFSPTAVLMAEHQGVFALANLRGGGEFGDAWHKAGMLENKQNVFDDFIAAAEYLQKNGYTSPSKLAIEGTSNGGLLVAAALTQRPDLFQAVVCRYPLIDMIRYQKFLVASTWVPEYGSSDDAGQFKYIYAYSPYQHVKPGTNYPAVLMVSGDNDTRVDPLHARKMAALLQTATASSRPVLLDYDTKCGHSGGRPLAKQIEDLVDELGFVLWQTGATL
jgi:prolyl oligopeptidase